MGVSLNKRPCKIGKLNPRVEFHGEDEVPAMDIAISGILIDKEELGELLNDQYAHRALFNTKGKSVEPMFPQFEARELKDSYEKSHVTLYLGLSDDAVKFNQVKLKRITLAPQTGGLTEISLQVQTTAEKDAAAELYVHMGHSAHCSIRFGKLEERRRPQPELPLGDAPDNVVPLRPDEVPGPLDA